MTDAPAAPASAERAPASNAPDLSHRLRPLSFWEAFSRPGKVIYDDQTRIQLVVAEGWGMQELVVRVRGEIDERSFERLVLDRDHLQAQMKPYFEAQIEITPETSASPRLPQLPWPKAARNAIVAFLALGFAVSLAPLLYFSITLAQLTWLSGIVAGVAMGGLVTFIFLSRLMERFKTDKIWPGLMEERLSAAILSKFPNNDEDVRAVIDAYNHVFLDSNWMLIRLKRFFQGVSILCFYLAAAAPLYFL